MVEPARTHIASLLTSGEFSEGQNGTPKNIAKKLEQKKATQRKTAEALGVGVATVNRDIKPDVPNETNEEDKTGNKDNKESFKDEDVPNGTKDTEIPPKDTEPLFTEDPAETLGVSKGTVYNDLKDGVPNSGQNDESKDVLNDNKADNENEMPNYGQEVSNNKEAEPARPWRQVL